MVDVPTTDDLKESAVDGGVPGTASALGQTLGRSTLGPGLGTAIGGTVAASAFDGSQRETMAMLAFERGMSELFAGAMSSGGGGGNSRGRM